MKPFVWNPEMTTEETKNGAYWERNMLALYIANYMNTINNMMAPGVFPLNGWYHHGEYEGWSRVVSIARGSITFHVPDNFDLGTLPEIQPNWDGHTTEEKWSRLMIYCGVEPDGVS